MSLSITKERVQADDSSSSDEDFQGFSQSERHNNILLNSNEEKTLTSEICKEELTCYGCKLTFGINTVNIDQPTFNKIRETKNFGTRWHCSSCLIKTIPKETMPCELDYKQILKEELGKIQQNFNQQLELFKISIITTIQNCHKPHTETTSSYANILCKNLRSQTRNVTMQVPVTSSVIATPSPANAIPSPITATSSPATAISSPITVTPSPVVTTVVPATPPIPIDPEELRQRKRKKLNVILYSLPESTNPNESVAYQEDMLKLKDVLFEKDGFNPEHVKRAYRIGIKSMEKTRPIRIIFTNESTRANVLSMKDLIYKNDSEIVKLFTNEDRTPMQLEQQKILVQELKMRREEGEEDITIRNGQIVRKQPFRPSPQTVWANPT